MPFYRQREYETARGATGGPNIPSSSRWERRRQSHTLTSRLRTFPLT